MSKPDPDPRKILGAKAFNSMSHRRKVVYRKTAKHKHAVMFAMSYSFGAQS